MDFITTATGRRIGVDMVSSIPQPPMLYIRVVEMDLIDVASVFNDSHETESITYGGLEFKGYRLDALINEGDAIRVNLRKE